jgi:hypothetical protein
VSRARKLAFTAVLFAAATGLLIISVATKSTGPLFAMWIPLLAVPWILARPEPADEAEEPPPAP